MKNFNIQVLLFIVITSILFSCKSGPFNLLKPASPHQEYERKLVSAGLGQTIMGTAWINNSQKVLQQALTIKLPYQEKGYFSAEKVDAAAFRFSLAKGQQLQVKITKNTTASLAIYADVWEAPVTNDFKLLVSADTLGSPIQLDVEETGNYILRLQPELLGSGSYTLEITTGPSLKFPLKTANRNQIQSLWGVGRDNNTRRHEGVDIFAPFRTPVIAVSAGTVTGVNMNNLGGKVVWFRPQGKDYTLYYAHLDEQTVTEGQSVKLGDTLGRMGSTGNAQGGPPHLHFGIYTSAGAIDPLPFINPNVEIPPKINSSTIALNTTMRTVAKASLQINNGGQLAIKSGTVVRIGAANGNDFKVELPDGTTGYIASSKLAATSKPIAKFKVNVAELAVYDKPDIAASIKSNLVLGQTVAVLGFFGDYQLMLDADNQTGWIRK